MAETVKEVGRTIGAAAAAVMATMALFNSFLIDLVPPINRAQLLLGMVSIGATVVLLALSVLIGKRLTGIKRRRHAAASLGMLAITFIAFAAYSSYFQEYVLDYPKASGTEQIIHGELHEKGRSLAEGMTLSEAVRYYGGPGIVVPHEILWSEEATNKVITRLRAFYMLIAVLLTTSLYIVALVVVRLTAADRGH
ncbi:MAG TPA: hypothetical protein VNQ97_07935 [Burkholderiaceae bacterium]|nr:hypothetical protein [Burkholderiaceae bacterium]